MLLNNKKYLYMSRLDSIKLAKHIAYLCAKHGYTYNNTKIQKLMYICYGTFLADKSINIINEKPRILYYGPIFASALRYIQALKNINELPINQSQYLDKYTKHMLNDVVKKVGLYSATSLVEWSHRANKPWSIAQAFGGLEIGDFIPDSFTKSAFVIEPYTEIKL
jgi:uncharacterized phage-associated protein